MVELVNQGPVKVEFVQLNVKVDSRLKKDFRKATMDNNTSMAKALGEFMKDYVSKSKKVVVY